MKEKIKKFKNKKLLILLVLAVVGAILIGSSYAFFGSFVGDAAITDANIESGLTRKLIFIEGDDISLNATSQNFADGDGSLTSSTVSSASLKKSSSEDSATETYQVYYNVTNNDFVYTVDENTPELLLKIVDSDGNEITTLDGLSYKIVTDAHNGNTLTGFDITTFEGLIKIKEDQSITSTDTVNATIQDWTITITFVNLATNQSLNEGKNLSSSLILQKDKIAYLNEHVIDLHGGVDGTNDLYYTNNAEYRYSGATPNNYVWFNDELWRIIGVFDDASHGVTDTNLVKIIKEESIGDYMFDNKVDNGGVGYNSWSDDNGGAELNQLLNGYYYNGSTAPDNLAGCNNTDYYNSQLGVCDFSSTGLSSTSINMLEEVTWYLGGYSSSDATASMAYTAERGIAGSTAPGAHLTYTGNIGLMYMSDYGYATEPSSWNTSMYNYGTNNIYINDWLFNGEFQWSMTPLSSNSTYEWYIRDGGYGNNFYSTFGINVRPVLYLNSEVKISGGTGSETEPFLLEM